jgi:predicted DNA binding CopG/RHH family protein
MSENKKIPEFESYEEMAEFWDTHDLTDYWEQTEPAEFEISPQARRRYLVSLDRNLLLRIQKIARIRGITTESLINLFLEQHLNEIEAQT